MGKYYKHLAPEERDEIVNLSVIAEKLKEIQIQKAITVNKLNKKLKADGQGPISESA